MKTKDPDSCPLCGSKIYIQDTNTGFKWYCKSREKGCNWEEYV